VTNSPSPRPRESEGLDEYAIDLYWIPVDSGGNVVRLIAKFYEMIDALIARRPRCHLFHSALGVRLPNRTVIIEMTRIPRHGENERGVITEGPVGLRPAGRFRRLRYEVRCWHEGEIRGDPKVSPVHLSADEITARRLLDLTPYAPTLVWGRDEQRIGDPWSSNSVVSWLLESSGVDAARLAPPEGGRAPGWCAGISAARRGLLRAPTVPPLRRRRNIRLRISAPRRIATPMVVDDLTTSR
jgi:hypothetical protein